jgi:endonuclease YncB( thermonuclease family)
VALEPDVEKVDPCGRPSAYAWVAESRIFNEALVDEGYAQMATFPLNVKYVERFKGAQREANRGLWGLSEG